MGDIVRIDFTRSTDPTSGGFINTARLAEKRRRPKEGSILPALSDKPVELAEEHASEPIKRLEDIARVSRYLIENERYRDNMLFITGINFGLRVSDLLTLRFNQLIDDDFNFRESFAILEKKTKNTRKVQKNRYITINEAVIDAVTLYLEHNPRRLDDYMFVSESNRGINSGKPLHRASVDRLLKEIAEACGLTYKVATHTLRKTFGYHQMVMSGNDPRKLLLLQKMFGHSTSMQTLDYIGITGEEIAEAYQNLNLGSPNHYVDSRLYESAHTAG